jgi:uncharacterized protein YuzE
MRDSEKIDLINKWYAFFRSTTVCWSHEQLTELNAQIVKLFAAIASDTKVMHAVGTPLVNLLNQYNVDTSDSIWKFLDTDAVSVIHEPGGDVLYVLLAGEKVWMSDSIESDNNTILNHNKAGEPVGLQVLDASELTTEIWDKFKSEIPLDLFEAVMSWIKRSKH